MERAINSDKTCLLILTNDLTNGAIPHLVTDIIPELGNYRIYVAATRGGGEDRVSESVFCNLEEAGAHPLRFHFDTKPFPIAATELYSFLDTVDLVQTHLIYSGIIGRLIGKMAGVPVVSTEHRIHDWKQRQNQIFSGLTLPFADTVIAVSKQVQYSFNPFEKLLLYTTPQEIIYNSSNPSLIHQMEHSMLKSLDESIFNSAAPVIVSVGRLIPEKNHKILIKALPAVQSTYPDVNMVLVGDGELRGDLEQLAEQLDVSESVTITGWIDHLEVGAILNNSDIYAMPSEHEGMGIALVEAMFAGLPVLLSDIPVFREVAGDTAVYVQNDVRKWANQLIRVIETDMSERTEHAKRRASEMFRPDVVADRYDQTYQKVLQ